MKNLGVGGNVNYTFGGKGQVNKQRTRSGSIDGYQKEVPDININKYAGKKAGGAIRTDLQKANKKETDHGQAKLFKEGGVMKHDDIKEDKALIKKAFKMHDKQEHKGSKGTNLTKLCRGGGIETKGKTKGRMV